MPLPHEPITYPDDLALYLHNSYRDGVMARRAGKPMTSPFPGTRLDLKDSFERGWLSALDPTAAAPAPRESGWYWGKDSAGWTILQYEPDQALSWDYRGSRYRFEEHLALRGVEIGSRILPPGEPDEATVERAATQVWGLYNQRHRVVGRGEGEWFVADHELPAGEFAAGPFETAFEADMELARMIVRSAILAVVPAAQATPDVAERVERALPEYKDECPHGFPMDPPCKFCIEMGVPPVSTTEAGTPGARWREEGKSDPHGDRYDRERATLCGGHLTDDEIANAVFLDPSIMNLTAAKDRIRWLSRQLQRAQMPASPAEASDLARADYIITQSGVLRENIAAAIAKDRALSISALDEVVAEREIYRCRWLGAVTREEADRMVAEAIATEHRKPDTNSHAHIIDMLRYWLGCIDTRDPDLHRLLLERNIVVTSLDGGNSPFQSYGAFPVADYPGATVAWIPIEGISKQGEQWYGLMKTPPAVASDLERAETIINRINNIRQTHAEDPDAVRDFAAGVALIGAVAEISAAVRRESERAGWDLAISNTLEILREEGWLGASEQRIASLAGNSLISR